MELLILILTAHLIGDFYAQPKSWVACRNSKHFRSKGLWLHTLVHAFLYTVVVLISNIELSQALTLVVLISTMHLITDVWKSYMPATLTFFLIDQAIHIIVIFIAWLLVSSLSFNELTAWLKPLITTNNLVILIAYLLVCKPTSVIISLALNNYTLSSPEAGLASAGAWIGYLERCLAISFIFSGHFAGIGFLVATKTIFRFGDLTKSKDMKLTEYMMLGTLLSFALALLIGWTALALYTL